MTGKKFRVYEATQKGLKFVEYLENVQEVNEKYEAVKVWEGMFNYHYDATKDNKNYIIEPMFI